MKAKKILTALLCMALAAGSAGITASAEVDNTTYTEMLEELGYTFTLSGVHITETGYYTLDGTKVDTAEEADVEVTDTVNKKMKYLNGTTLQDVSKVFEVEHTEWEKEAIGVYLAGVKITETGYYNNDGSAADDEGTVYVDIEKKTITLSGADISLTNGEMTLLENIVDPDYTAYKGKSLYDNITGVPGALVITEGTYNTPGAGAGAGNWDCYYYLPIGYETTYKFGSIALGIMADDESGEDYEDWTLELEGENKITVNSSFGMPQQIGYVLDAPAYGVFAEADLTITGEGSLEAVVNNNWNILKAGYKDTSSSSAGGVWSKGDLNITGGTVSATTSTTGVENSNYGITTTGNNTAAAIGAVGALTISGEDTVVKAKDTTTQGIAVRGGTSVTITDDANVSAESVSDVAGVAIAAVTGSGWYSKQTPVTISDGANVTATTTSTSGNDQLDNGVGIAGSVVTITDATLDVDAYENGVKGDSVTISGGTVTVDVSAAEGSAVVADKAEISSGTYNTTLPDTYFAEDSGIVDGTVMDKEDITEWSARLGDSVYYTDADGGAIAIANADFDKNATSNNVVWINADTTAERTGLSLGDTITVHVAQGAKLDLTLKGDKLIPTVEEIDTAALAADEVVYTTYKYTMTPDPEHAIAKIVTEGKEDRYYISFGNQYEPYTIDYDVEAGDKLVILKDIDFETDDDMGDNIYIYDGVTLDLNGHTLSSGSKYYVVATYFDAKATITDSSEASTGRIVNTHKSGVAVLASLRSTLTIENADIIANSTNGKAVNTANNASAILMGGDYTGTIAGNVTISGGRYSIAPDASYIAEGYEIIEIDNAELPYAVGVKTTNTINVAFADATPADARDYKLYNINLESATADNINRLNSADLTFALTQVSGNNAYEIIDIADDNIAVNNVEGDRYEFHFETKTDVENDTANTITVAQVKVTGYGKYSFAVAAKDADGNDITTNIAHATEALDNIVDTFTPDGDVNAGEGYLDIGTGTGEVEIFAPTQDLTIKVAFPNAIINNKLAYQAMNVLVTGEDIADISIDLGTDNTDADLTLTNKTDAAYTVAFDEATSVYTIVITNALTANTAYNVTVSGAGYRTARYTVNTQEKDKILNFWNNVKDNAFNVEEDKDSSAKNVTFLAGDIVKDSIINVYDLSAVVSYFGEIDLNKTGEQNDYAKYDLNRDGKIDSKDVAYVLVSWGN